MENGTIELVKAQAEIDVQKMADTLNSNAIADKVSA